MQPAAEDDCVHPIDANRDGMITCACAPGAMTACMTGLKAECAAGLATCKADSSGYGDCVPGVTPTAKPNGDQVISTLVLDGSSKLDATFNSLRGKSFNVNAKALRFDASTNRLVFAGSVTGNVNFGTGQLTRASAASGDLALAKLQP